MNCEILTVGTELVLGFTVNTNAADLGRMLSSAGCKVLGSSSVPDEPALVKAAVQAALERAGMVVISGGLGPTNDDLTKAAVAELFGRTLVRDEAIVTELRERFKSRGVPNMPESNLVQADVPEGATVLPNERGTAPGLWMEDNGRLAILLPGVPKEMRGLMEKEVLPRLLARMDGGTGGPGDRKVVKSRTLRTAGIGESAVADRLGDYQKSLGANVTLAFLPTLHGTDLRLTAWNLGDADADAALARGADAIRPAVSGRLYGEGDTDLAAVVLDLLAAANATLATAESCTGGVLSARITAIPGSSRVFKGGFVAYANDVKLDQLGVSADVIAEHGAVSEATARAMAQGAARVLGTDAAIAITGIAGPDGGTEDKPVGTVWMAVQWKDRVRAFMHVFPGDREDVRGRSAQWALDYLRRAIADAPA